MLFRTDQEEFWAGCFGNEYIERNKSEKLVASNIALFSRILERTRNVHSVVEFGSNVGLNLRAIEALLPDATLSAVEINKRAVSAMKSWGKVEIYHDTILDFKPDKRWDFTLIKGVLIHIDPCMLMRVYESLYQVTKRYICIAEYYSPVPVRIPYRGHSDKLFKRDFAGEMLDKYPDLRLVDYGFVYHRDNSFSQDDVTWFLLEKC